MSPQSSTKPPKAPSPWKRAFIVPLLATIVVTIVALALTWPMQTMETKDVTISVVGSDQQKDQLENQMESSGRAGTLDLLTADSRDEAVNQIEQRQSYGAIIFSEDSAPEVLTAQAANSQIYALLNGLAGQMTTQIQSQAHQKQVTALTQAVDQANSAVSALDEQIAALQGEDQGGEAEQGQLEELQAQRDQASAGAASAQAQLDSLNTQAQAQEATTVKTSNLVPYSADDPNGVGLSMAYLPTVLGGIIGGALISFGLVGARQRLVAMLVYGLLAGAALAAMFSLWFSAIPMGFGAAWLLYSASLLGTGLFIIGVGTATGITGAGVGAGALVTMFIGNPLSGMTVPSSFIWGGLGQLGQWLVPGATNALLRYESYFPAADTSHYWLALALWMLLGLVLLAVGLVRERRQGRLEVAV